MIALRVRVGVARFDDGWNVVVSYGGQVEVYDPTFPTEAEADAKRRELADAFCEQLAQSGLVEVELL